MRGWAILAVGVLCAGCGQVADAQTQLVLSLRIKSATADYQRARTPLDRCVKAKMVAAAYSDARDVAETQAWEAREHEDCRVAAAGLGVSPTGAAKP